MSPLVTRELNDAITNAICSRPDFETMSRTKASYNLEDFLGLDQTGWTAVSAIATTATFIGGLIAVIVALRQIKQARQVHDDQVRPYVIVDIEPNPASWFIHDLVIRNIGQTPAIDCRIKLDPTPTRSGESGDGSKLADAKVLNEPIAMVAPGREIRLFFDSMLERIHTDLPMLYTAEVTYRANDSKMPWRETYTLDVATLKNAENITVYTIHHAAKALMEIRKDLRGSKLLSGPLEVFTETRRERIGRLRIEREERIARYQQTRDSNNEEDVEK